MGFFTNERGQLKMGKVAATAGAGLLGLISAISSITTVKETERGLDYRFGKMTTTDATQLRKPGLGLKLPFFSDVVKVPVDLQQKVYEGVQTYTKDNQTIHATLSVMYKIPEGRIVEIYKNNPDYETKLEKTVFDAAKSALGKQDAQNVAQNRNAIMQSVTEETKQEVNKLLGMQVVSVQLPNFDFDAEFNNAVKKAANAKAVLNEKKTELEQREVEKNKTIVDAEAAAKNTRLKADADAYAKQQNFDAEAAGRLKLKEAEAKGFNAISQSIGREHMDTYLKTDKWKGDTPVVSGGTPVIDGRNLIPALK